MSTREELTDQLADALGGKARDEALARAADWVDAVWRAACEAALTAAADDVRERRHHGLRDGEESHPTSEWIERWLRDRAARRVATGEQP